MLADLSTQPGWAAALSRRGAAVGEVVASPFAACSVRDGPRRHPSHLPHPHHTLISSQYHHTQTCLPSLPSPPRTRCRTSPATRYVPDTSHPHLFLRQCGIREAERQIFPSVHPLPPPLDDINTGEGSGTHARDQPSHHRITSIDRWRCSRCVSSPVRSVSSGLVAAPSGAAQRPRTFQVARRAHTHATNTTTQAHDTLHQRRGMHTCSCVVLPLLLACRGPVRLQ